MFSFEDMTFYGEGEDPAEGEEEPKEEVEGPPAPPPTMSYEDREKALKEERKRHHEHDEFVSLDEMKELWKKDGVNVDDDIDF